MRRFIITGAPGSGKTAIIRHLELEGFSIVEEAATDVIAAYQSRGILEPWKDATFIDAVADLQEKRLARASHQMDDVQFHDRSIFCTAALATYLGYPFSGVLTNELERVTKESVFERRVFFVQNLGFVKPTEARRISFEETLRFEKIHEDIYRKFGFELFPVEPASPLERVRVIKSAIGE